MQGEINHGASTYIVLPHFEQHLAATDRRNSNNIYLKLVLTNSIERRTLNGKQNTINAN